MDSYVNDTMRRFGYPDSCIREYGQWVVLLRPVQLTAGSLVIAHKGPETVLCDTSASAFTELKKVTYDVNQILKSYLSPKQVNYLALMMTDPHVHFHVIPRYNMEKRLYGIVFTDLGWPGPPSFTHQIQVDESWISSVKRDLQSRLPE